MFCVVTGACAQAEEIVVHQAYNTPQYRWQHANKWPKKQLYNRDRETVLSVVYNLRQNEQLSTGPTIQHSIAS